MKTSVILLSAGFALSACSGDPRECKDTKYEVIVPVTTSMPFVVGGNNPEIEAGKLLAQTKWEAEVKEKFGAEWATFDNTKRHSTGCDAATGSNKWQCSATAAPCKMKAK